MKKLQVNLQSKALCVKHGWILSSTRQNCVCFPGTLTSLPPVCLLSVSVSDPCPDSNNCYPQPFRIAISSSRPAGPNYETWSMNFTWLARRMWLWLKNILVPHCRAKVQDTKEKPQKDCIPGQAAKKRTTAVHFTLTTLVMLQMQRKLLCFFSKWENHDSLLNSIFSVVPSLLLLPFIVVHYEPMGTWSSEDKMPKKFCFSKADKELGSRAHKAIHVLDKNLRKTLSGFLCTQ